MLLLSSRHTTDGRNYRDNYSLLAIADTFEINQTVKISDENLNGNIVKLKTKSAEILAIADSGSSISFLNETTARRIHQNDKSTVKKFPPEDTARNLSCYNRKDIIPKGRLILAKEFGEWTIESAPYIVVDDQNANILGRNLLPNIGKKLVQEKPQYKQVLNIIEEDKSHPEMVRKKFHKFIC